MDLLQDSLAKQRLYDAVETAKLELASKPVTTINLPFITADASGPKHLHMDVTQAQISKLACSLLEKLQTDWKAFLEQVQNELFVKEGLPIVPLQAIVCSGGAMRLPFVPSYFTSLRHPLLDQTTRTVIPDAPEELVCTGASTFLSQNSK